MTFARALPALLLSATVSAQQFAYEPALDAYIDCADQYVAVGLALKWNATASDLADAAFSKCEPEAKKLETALLRDKELNLDLSGVKDSMDGTRATLRLTLIRHIVETRNLPPTPSK